MFSGNGIEWIFSRSHYTLHSCPMLERGFPIMEVEDSSSTERGKYHSTKHFFLVDQAQIQKTSGGSDPVLHMGKKYNYDHSCHA